SAEYGVLGDGDFKVTAVTGADRTVSIATGSAWGKGVFDTNSANITIQLDTISTGTRWDLIAIHRNWSGAGGTTTVIKINGSSSKAIPARSTDPGNLDDQPLALVQVTAGQTQPTAIVDLRVWAGNGGSHASDVLALNYLTRLGAQVTIAGEEWGYLHNPAGTPAWAKLNSPTAVGLFGTGGALVGLPPAVSGGPQFLMQAGSTVTTTDSNGFAGINFPTPFPNGLLTVVTTNGDSSIDRAFGHVITLSVAGAPWGSGAKNGFVFSAEVEDSAGTHRVYMVAGQILRCNWIAIGW
ncbi:MAG TPA: hypothetical protein VNA32_10180, partial [Actinomycetota bacterium]|nr:hypothetical protein [Actinomycetota bacterium]